MKIIMILSLMIMFILLMMTMMLNLLSKKMQKDREKHSPFECGFDPKNLARLPFSLQFFLIAIIFVIFDVELTLLLPVIIIKSISAITNLLITTNTFIMILLLGIYHEKNQGALNWVM